MKRKIVTFGWILFWASLAAALVHGLYLNGADEYGHTQMNWSSHWSLMQKLDATFALSAYLALIMLAVQVIFAKVVRDGEHEEELYQHTKLARYYASVALLFLGLATYVTVTFTATSNVKWMHLLWSLMIACAFHACRKFWQAKQDRRWIKKRNKALAEGAMFYS